MVKQRLFNCDWRAPGTSPPVRQFSASGLKGLFTGACLRRNQITGSARLWVAISASGLSVEAQRTAYRGGELLGETNLNPTQKRNFAEEVSPEWGQFPTEAVAEREGSSYGFVCFFFHFSA